MLRAMMPRKPFAVTVGTWKERTWPWRSTKRKHRHFVGWWKKGFTRRLPAHVGLVHFDGHASAAKPVSEYAAIFGHGFADTMPQEPSGFHAAIEHPLDLPGRNAFLATAKQMDDLEPEVEGQVAILENRSRSAP